MREKDRKRGILHIAVNKSRRVNKLQSLQDIDGEFQNERKRKRIISVVDDVVKTSAAHEFGDDAEIGGFHAYSHEQHDILFL